MCPTRAATIDMLVDDVLLDIFDFCRNMYCIWHLSPPRFGALWHILVHVCRRWRKIIFDSPRRLNLRILCTYGTPVRKHLGVWPAFPIDLQFLFPIDLRPEDEDHAIAALEHRDRLHSVSLFAYGPQLAKFAALMQEPFPVLTELLLHSQCENTPVLTAGFLGGSAPHLRAIILHCIPFPALPTLLLSTSDLVILNLHDIPTPGYISPERMVESLAGLPRLKALTITFQDSALRCDRIHTLPVTRPVLPALTNFEFRGTFRYLEDFVAQIDSPQLKRISIIYWAQIDDVQLTLPQVSDFIDRSIGPDLTPTTHARVYLQQDRVTFTLSRDYDVSQGRYQRSVTITISHAEYKWLELSDLVSALGHYSAALCTVVHLELDDEIQEGGHPDEWFHLFRHFPLIQTLHASVKLAEPVSVTLDLITAEMVTEMLPSLGLICLEGEPVSSLENFVSICRFSGHPITVVETTEEFKERFKSCVSI